MYPGFPFEGADFPNDLHETIAYGWEAQSAALFLGAHNTVPGGHVNIVKHSRNLTSSNLTDGYEVNGFATSKIVFEFGERTIITYSDCIAEYTDNVLLEM